jgi:hypothetical protein
MSTKFYCSLLLLLFIGACLQDVNDTNKTPNLTPRILAVYPSADSLPENLLRLYIQFSQPMKAVDNLKNIKLVNEEGLTIEGAIFNNVYELWDQEQKQLTLILDPSRVKTGLVAHNNLGRALVPGKHFQLIIEKAEDIDGNLLKAPYVKDIYVQKEDRIIPDINHWSIHPPAANSKAPLTIDFPQILDQLSLLNSLLLLDENQQTVQGKVTLLNQETKWQFTPTQKWKPAVYTLLVNNRLEDPAGNNLNGLFDHAVGSLKNEQEGMITRLSIVID